MLARMAAYPRRVDQELARLREGMALGWVAPRSVLSRVLAQLDAQLAPVVEPGPFFLPFTQLGSDIPAAEQSALRAQAGRQSTRTCCRRCAGCAASSPTTTCRPHPWMAH